jgi:hypothetical protein
VRDAHRVHGLFSSHPHSATPELLQLLTPDQIAIMKSSLSIAIFEKFLGRKFLLGLKKKPVSLK